MPILIKTLFKPTKTKLFFVVGLFLAVGFLQVFTLQNSITGVVYKNSLFQQYKFQYQHSGDSWYSQDNKYYWNYVLFLHLAASYIVVGIISFIVNRLRGRE